MDLLCPNCKIPIEPENVNIATDIAKCISCNSLFHASELLNKEGSKKIDEPPLGTSIKVKKGLNESVELILPQRGFRKADWSRLSGLLFLVFFNTIWTLIAYKAPLIFILTGLIFWFIAFAGLFRYFNLILEKQSINLDKTTLTLTKKKLIKTEIIQIPNKEIGSITGESGWPSIIHGAKTISFFEYINKIEREWVTKALDSLVRKINSAKGYY